ncbi:MAG: hypothetical protein AAF500_14265 [Myxococcota bacterium]
MAGSKYKKVYVVLRAKLTFAGAPATAAAPKVRAKLTKASIDAMKKKLPSNLSTSPADKPKKKAKPQFGNALRLTAKVKVRVEKKGSSFKYRVEARLLPEVINFPNTNGFDLAPGSPIERGANTMDPNSSPSDVDAIGRALIDATVPPLTASLLKNPTIKARAKTKGVPI